MINKNKEGIQQNQHKEVCTVTMVTWKHQAGVADTLVDLFWTACDNNALELNWG